MAKIVFASPTYGPVDPQALRSQRVAIMNAAQKHTWVGDASPDRMKFDASRNAVALSAVETGADYVFWCDSDIILEADTISRLLQYEKDFVTGIYFQREGEKHSPLISMYNEDTDSFSFVTFFPENVFAPMDACGFGCVVTSVKMLRDIEKQCLARGEKGWFEYRKFSEDFDFCMRAKECGYQLYVDTGALVGHLGDAVPVTYDTYKKAHPELYPVTQG